MNYSPKNPKLSPVHRPLTRKRASVSLIEAVTRTNGAVGGVALVESTPARLADLNFSPFQRDVWDLIDSQADSSSQRRSHTSVSLAEMQRESY